MRKITRAFISLLAIIIMALPLSSCRKIFGDKHEHAWKYYIAKQPTCTQNGIMEKLCDECGEKGYEDITPSGHNFINGVCTVCGEEGVDENALVRIPLPEDSNNTAKWSLKDIYEKTKTLVRDFDNYPDDVGFAKFLNGISHGYLQDVYLDTLHFLHFNISWTTTKNETLEAPFIWTVGKVSPVNTTEKKFSTVYRVEISEQQLCITYSDGVQTVAGSFTTPIGNQPLVTAFGINPDNELVVYYADNTIAFAGVVAQGATAENQASFSYKLNANGYEIASVLDKNATHLEIPISHRGKAVTSIRSNTFNGLTKLETVVVPTSITSFNYESLLYGNSAHFFFEQNRPNTIFTADIAPYLHFKGEWSYVNGIPTVN